MRKRFFVSFFISLQKFVSLTKEAGTGFLLLFQSRNTIGILMKTYLHRLIEILPFVPAGIFKRH